MHLYKHLGAMACLASILTFTFTAFAQTDKTTTPGPGDAASSTSPSPGLPGKGSIAGTPRILLIGEAVSVPGRTKHPVLQNIAEITTAALGGTVIDQTQQSATLGDLVKTVETALSVKPEIVLILAGNGDETSGTSSQAQQNNLTSLGNAFASTRARVFVIPSSLSISASTSANLRIAASGAQITFIEPGPEFEGKPYQHALEEIRKSLNEAPVTTDSSQPVRPEEQSAPTGSAGSNLTPELKAARKVSPPKHGIFTAPTPASVEAEVSRPATAPVTENQKKEETVPFQRQVTKRGAEAKPETIWTKPLSPLKSFSPRKSASREEVNRKSPELSR